MATKIKSGQTILFIGDSITDCGRRGPEQPLGNDYAKLLADILTIRKGMGIGYVKLFADMLTIREPKKRITVINKGIGADGITRLQNRWSEDVLRYKPDWVSILIGIADILHFREQRANAVTPHLYYQAYDDILSRTKTKLSKCQILLMAPFYISSGKLGNSQDKQVLDLLQEYIQIVHKLSRKYKTRLVKIQELFQKLLKHHEEPAVFSLDRSDLVHANLTGHLAIAEAMYSALSVT